LALTGCENLASGEELDRAADAKLSGTITISLPSGVTAATTGTELTAVYNGTEAVTYRWNKDGTPLDDAAGRAYIPIAAGNYTVTVGAEDYESKTSAPVTVTGAEVPAPPCPGPSPLPCTTVLVLRLRRINRLSRGWN
jgi:hypothetical protein